MIEVSKAAFFCAIGPCDIHPRSGRAQTDWIDQKTWAVLGRSTPGYLDDVPNMRKRYWLDAAFAKTRNVPALEATP
jgi:hypothetical protein